MARLYVLFAAIALAAQVSARWEMIWNDEFNGPSINSSKWQHEVNCWGGGNNEQQCYTARPQNSYISNGTVVLKAIPGWYTGTQNDCTDPQGCTNTLPYTSARLRTMMDPQGSWTGGRFEISARLPDGAFLWPAIWMLPRDSSYGGWAASGEIDIMEMRGQALQNYGTTLHYGGSWPHNRYQAVDLNMGIDLSRGFHQWALEWEPAKVMRVYFDGVLKTTIDLQKWWWDASLGNANPYSAMGQPWDKPFYMILNMAVGGSYFGGWGSMPADQGSKWRDPTMAVDYVRVYKWTDAPATTNAVSTAAVSTKAVTTQAVTTEAVSTQAVTTGAVTTEAATTERVTTDGATTEAVTTENPTTGSTEPSQVEPATTGAPVEPTSSEPEPTTSEPEVSLPATTGSVPVVTGTAETSETPEVTGDAVNTTVQAGATGEVANNEDGNNFVSKDQQDKTTSKTDTTKIAIIVGCIGGAVVLAAVAALFVRKQKLKQKTEPATVSVNDLVI